MTSGITVVTGAGSGIGWACVEALSQRGHTVIAGVFDDAQAQRIDDARLAGVTSMRLDVTNADHVAAAADLVDRMAETHGPLRGLVNNAGIVVAGPLEFLPDADLRLQFEVNVLGLMAMTRAMLPALRRAQGRIVNIGSVGGRLAVPFTGPYGASKFAVRALSDALRMELRGSGVQVALIEPGPIATEIWDRSLGAAERRLQSLPPAARQRYAQEIEIVTAGTRRLAAHAIPVSHVVDAVLHALTATRPRAQRLVGVQAHVQAWVSRLPPRLRDVVLLRAMGLSGRHR